MRNCTMYIMAQYFFTKFIKYEFVVIKFLCDVLFLLESCDSCLTVLTFFHWQYTDTVMIR